MHVYIRQLYGLELKYTLIQLQNENIDILSCKIQHRFTNQIYFAFLFNKRYNVKELNWMKQLASENTMY